MRRSLSLLGFATLLLAACHNSGPGGTTMDPMDPMNPMMYRAPALRAQANRTTTNRSIPSCTPATAIQLAPSACGTPR